MPDMLDGRQGITWRSPKGTLFNIKTTESGYSRKHNGEVKTNPSGKKSTKKAVTDSNDTFSDLGIAGRDVSLECLFIGKTHAADAKKFTDALCETGKSHLRLAYGDEFTVNVLDFSVKNDLLKAINATVVTVKFHETAKTTYPESQTGEKKEIKTAAANTKSTVAQNLANAVEDIKNDTTRTANFTANFNKMLNTVSTALNTADSVTLNSIMSDILGQNVMNNALTMTSQLQIVMSKSAALASKVTGLSTFNIKIPLGSAFDSWRGLITSLIQNSTPTGSVSSNGLSNAEIDSLLINDTTAVSALASLCETAIDTEFETRKEAVETAKKLIELEETWTEYIETQTAKITELGNVFTRDSNIVELVAAAAGEILNLSYELKVEKTIILTEDKTLVELAYENYYENFKDDPDGAIEYLRTSNNFTDDEFFLLPKGKGVKIYV